jgi:hypothetical protein
LDGNPKYVLTLTKEEISWLFVVVSTDAFKAAPSNAKLDNTILDKIKEARKETHKHGS